MSGPEPYPDDDDGAAVRWREVAGPARRLWIFIGDTDRYHHKPLEVEILDRARAAGLAGATVLHGIEGFGASRYVHTTRLLDASDNLPLVLVIIDAADRIDAFLPHLDDLVIEGLVALDDVEVLPRGEQGPTGPA